MTGRRGVKEEFEKVLARNPVKSTNLLIQETEIYVCF